MRTAISSLLVLGAVALLSGGASAGDVHRPVPTNEQTVAAVAACGVPASKIRISYEDEFQSEVVTISDLGGTGKARMDCVRKAVHVSYVVLIDLEDQRRAYYGLDRRQARIPASRLTSVQGRLAEIAASCGLPAQALELSGAGVIRFRPVADTNYEAVDCALVRMKQAGLSRHRPMGFVGNETYQTGNPK